MFTLPAVYCIVMKNHTYSEGSAKLCIDRLHSLNPELKVEIFDAVTPVTVDKVYAELGLTWKPDGAGSVGLPSTALRSAGPTNKSKASCAASHILLWKKAVENKQDVIIMEHDAWFLKTLDKTLLSEIAASPYKIISFRDMDREGWFYGVDKDFPSLTGSKCITTIAYYVKVSAAEEMLKKLYEIGHMPCNNDTFTTEWFGFSPLASVTECRVAGEIPNHKNYSTSSNWTVF